MSSFNEIETKDISKFDDLSRLKEDVDSDKHFISWNNTTLKENKDVRKTISP